MTFEQSTKRDNVDGGVTHLTGDPDTNTRLHHISRVLHYEKVCPVKSVM
jgi:hypothetical protein